MSNVSRYILCLMTACAVVMLGSLGAIAHVNVTADEAEKWADEFFARGLEKYRFSGAGIVVTKGGQPILTKGYGFSDYAQKVPFDALNTRFRIGSNTKTMTGTAIAQLLARGAIKDLNDSANTYLKRFQLMKNRG